VGNAVLYPVTSLTEEGSMERGYQYDFAELNKAMYDREGREKKARTMVAVLKDYYRRDLVDLSLLNVGSSTGIIDNVLSQNIGFVTGIDIDETAVRFANKKFGSKKLRFEVADGQHLKFKENSFDVVVCAQVYEHVPDVNMLINEIYRVLKPGGICYFSANNRFILKEPHYRLYFLSWLPRRLADIYMRLAGKGDHYYEKHLTYWGLTKLTGKFTRHDYTKKLLLHPEQFATEYMVKPSPIKTVAASVFLRFFYWLCPGYLWLLEKPLASHEK
jgi:2-polyprenyl-3-methyl-5-hydroxy-6-metoxy-1,4-benzoquinol methylase